MISTFANAGGAPLGPEPAGRHRAGPGRGVRGTADLPVVLAPDRVAARAIGDRHMTVYLNTENYRNNLARLGWSEADLEPPGSDELFDAIMAWGGPDQVAERMRALYEAGADQVILNLVTAQPRLPYLEELRVLAPLVAQPSA